MADVLNPQMDALNVVTAPVDADIVAEFETIARGPFPKSEFTTEHPPWNSDLQLITPCSVDAFRRFESAFKRLGIGSVVASRLDLAETPRMYVGFIIRRSQCTEPNFHADWLDTQGQAFTFITPISPNASGFGIVYRTRSGQLAEYDYKAGEGIFFSDHFIHSTKPGRSEEPVSLLCFTFGTDKMAAWDSILHSSSYQCSLMQRPDGQLMVRKRRFLRRGFKWVPRRSRA